MIRKQPPSQNRPVALESESVADRLRDLGDIPVERVRAKPPMGLATLVDLTEVNDRKSGAICELVDGTLVEKAMSYEASLVAAAIIRILSNFVVTRKLGLISGADGFFRLPAGNARGPDVAFVSRERLKASGRPIDAYPSLVPDLAVEVLSPGNTAAEMTRKRIEYFNAGVRLVWVVDCTNRMVRVYTAPGSFENFGDTATLGGGDVLPEFTTSVSDFFAELDIDWK